MTPNPRKPLLVNLMWAGVLALIFGPLLYVLSYAPLYHYRGRPPERLFWPVEWLIWNGGPSRYPLDWWSDKWGVLDDVRRDYLSSILTTGTESLH